MREQGEVGFFITVESDSFMTYEDVWPDGNIPENPTAQDVLEAMKKDGDKWTVISDWGLNDREINIHHSDNYTDARWV